VVAAFDGGAITSDAGALLLGATDRAIGLMSRFAGCFHARAASGHAAAPPSAAMNSRRRRQMLISGPPCQGTLWRQIARPKPVGAALRRRVYGRDGS
jgi:hypothetical protein